jgi:hypothetical protein
VSEQLLARLWADPKVRDAARAAMKAGHRNEILLITNIEDFAPKVVREAFDALLLAVAGAAQAAESEGP